MLNKTICGYTISRKIGEGGMAEVFYAENSIGKKAAVKVLKSKYCEDESVVLRFENEAKVMVRLDHPNITQVYDYGKVEDRPCIVMAFLEGSDLKTRMKNGERFSEKQFQKWWNQLADALEYTHEHNVVHRDIKPSNIFIDKYGDVKLMDFGIAKIKDAISITSSGTQIGTLLYMSPEQVQDSKHIDYRTDIYSLAITFVHLLTGKAPYDVMTGDYMIRKGIVEMPIDLSGVPYDWQCFLKPYLAKEPKDRPPLRHFEDAKAMSGDETFVDLGDRVEVVEPESPVRNSRKPTKKVVKIVLYCIGGLLGLFLLIGIICIVSERKKTAPEPEAVVEESDEIRERVVELLDSAEVVLRDDSIRVKDLYYHPEEYRASVEKLNEGYRKLETADKELQTFSDTPIGDVEKINDLKKKYKDNVYHFYFEEEDNYSGLSDKKGKYALESMNNMKILHKFVGFDDQEYQEYKRGRKK